MSRLTRLVNPVTVHIFELIRAGHREIDAYLATDGGRIMLDPTAAPNAKQNGIGPVFTSLASMGILRKTERTRTNPSPRRKGGLIRIWEVTDHGVWVAHRIEDGS